MNIGAVTKEDLITHYIKNIDFTKTNEINSKRIEEDLSYLLREKPAVKFDWIAEYQVNELTSEKKRVEKLSSIKVVYTVHDHEGKIAPKTLKFYI